MYAELIGAISNFMYGKLLIIMLIGVGLYYTFRTRFIQLRLLGETLRVITEKKADKNSVSSFQALMVSTASRVGTGNIIGVSTALCLGGFGSMFWMWLAAIVGGGSAFVESTLAQIYKKRGPHSSYGGPAYYIESALKNRFIAVIFALSLILTYGVGFNMLCAYNLQSTFSGFGFYDAQSTPWVIGGILAIMVGWCIFGGGRRIIRITSTLVPFMGMIYVLVAGVVTLLNIGLLPHVFETIFADAKAAGMDITVTKVGDRPCASSKLDAAAQARLCSLGKRIVEEVTGKEVGCHSSSTDCNIPMAMAIPAVCLGAYVGGGAHTREEWVERESFPQGLEVAIRTMLAVSEN